VDKQNPVVTLVTGKGDITVELFEDRVPNTVANFVQLSEKGFYKGMSFHRIIPGFMAQGGCPNSKPGARGMPGTGGPGYEFADEFAPGLRHSQAGVLSMANCGPDTNGSQFFLCFQAAPWLDGKHAVFGQVTSGLEVLKTLEACGSPSGKTTEGIAFDVIVVSKQDHPYAVRTL
jgi:cyclophilin family peptidyl-prolyl cis-trans isomerase